MNKTIAPEHYAAHNKAVEATRARTKPGTPEPTPEELKTTNRKISALSDLINPKRLNARKKSSIRKLEENRRLAYS